MFCFRLFAFIGSLVLCHSTIGLLAVPIKVPTEFYKDFKNLRDHPGHYPYISDITFRKICDVTIDEKTEWFDPDTVQQGDLLYLNIWYLEWFVKEVHDQIKNPYILLTHDANSWLPHPVLKKLLYDPKCAAWFCRNMVFSYHPKLYQNPMGQDIHIFDPSKEAVNDLIDIEKKKPFEKKHLLYMNHYPRPFGERDQIVKLFENEPYCFTRNHSGEEFQQLPRKEFYEDLAASKFVISPLGLETDCVRTWEAFIFDCIPIVEHTFLDPLYEGLPIIFVHDWTKINEQFLNEKYEELKHLTHERAYFDYWHQLITSVQNKIKEGDLSSSQLEATQFNEQDLKDFFSILTKYRGKNQNLLYKGFLSALRPLQLINSSSSLAKIYLHDPWLDRDMFAKFASYLKDPSILKNKHKVNVINEEFSNVVALESNPPIPVFFDLTYYRTSLKLNFTSSVISYGNFRQSFKQDLLEIYQMLKPGCLLFGNRANDAYVQEMLEIFSMENHIPVGRKGTFWFLLK